MIIENVAASFPKRRVDNDDVVELVRHYSSGYQGDLEKMLRVVKTLLDRSGLVARNWRAPGERPIDHLSSAVQDVLEGSGLRCRDIDLLVYVGIGGGFREPGNSYMVANTLGMHKAQCFDIVDACMSWTRALSLVDSLFKAGKFRNALVVNAEFNMIEGMAGFPENYAVRNLDEMNYLLPSYTIGEAATATLLLPHKPENFSVAFQSRPDLAHLCMIPTAGYQGYYEVNKAVAALGEGRFTALGTELHDALAEEMPALIRAAGAYPQNADVVFTHSSSMPAWTGVGKRYGFAEKIFHIYPQTGNVVSASIPAAMAMARRAGKLSKGDEVMCLMGSAGMSFALTKFVF
ncbi:3-oxoacyl-[acyl-carrier-protein] synthase III C-terminal domain-containing protein [Ramlibacter alkalitolerans]|jgi:3-oxoacyl-[acyl-carrier-protein] synthase III|uniref:3-oxoacyl-ACP synthase n=1 Tax=Ramlibacter alkalitolerans TaxID=2039631 RepID=A0ABS1JPP7_9BURK|nr:3-oxoacyl-[acyl-carrier-protein] synthase III C-terminal domain-containing protein [Ramlibacter alkalitolerans]MBL0426248.1 3-oxoacyl-ACP synthase [Ramlibacter alkalitolerans]